MKRLAKKININILLLICIYIEFFSILTGFVLPGFYNSLLKYIILTIMFGLQLILTNFYMSKKLFKFVLFYIIVGLLNILLVDYKYYVFIECFTSLIMFLPTIYIMSSKEFNLDNFFDVWYKFSQKSILLVVASLILYFLNIASYNIFANLLLPNIIIQCYYYFKKKGTFFDLCCLLLEILILVLFGGRLAAISAVLLFIYCAIFLRKMKPVNKAIIITCLVAFIILVCFNLKSVTNIIIAALNSIGIQSRTFTLLKKQLETGNFWSNFYLANRDSIYYAVGDYLEHHWLLPNGFGVTRYLTNGIYYHPHCLWIHLILMFGAPILVILAIIFLNKIRHKVINKDKHLDFLTMMLFFYFWRSLFDTNFLDYFASIIIISLVFFSNEKEYISFKIMFMDVVNNILWILPNKKLAHKIFYFLRTRKKLDLDNPKLLNEKLQYLIVNVHGQKEAMLADKYQVREFIEKMGYGNLLPKLYGVYKNTKEIDIDKLPDKFVLKTNNASGSTFVCTDKKNFDFENVKKELNKFMKINFGKKSLEYHYSLIEPLIICEEYIGSIETLPIDYKFFCFDGYVDSVLVCANRSEELTLDTYDLNWHYLEYIKPEFRNNKREKKPDNLKEMIEISSKLSKGFPYVRVDLYNCDGKIYFGELTFTPYSGVINYITDEGQEYYGGLIHLPKKGQKNE